MSDVEDIYPLTPVQEGILFHALSEPESSAYLITLSCRFEGDLVLADFRRAWEAAIEKHPTLRATIHWMKIDSPLQVVKRQLALPLTIHNWRDKSDADQQSAWANYLEQEKVTGFDLNRGPLWRLNLFQLNEQNHFFCFSFHHIMMDGWSLSILLEDVFEAYGRLRQDQALRSKSPRPFREYLQWRQQQNMDSAAEYWRDTLSDLDISPKLPDAHQAGANLELTRHLDGESTGKLTQFAKNNSITLNVLIQGLWSLLLSARQGTSDVLFGTTVSGRPTSLANSEQIVGLFINTIPVGIKVNPHELLSDWLQQLQLKQAEREEYNYLSLPDIRSAGGFGRDELILESLVVFENYPMPEEFLLHDVKLIDAIVEEHSEYPLTLILVPGDSLEIRLSARTDVYRRDAVTIIEQFQKSMQQVSDLPADASVGDAVRCLDVQSAVQYAPDRLVNLSAEFNEEVCIGALFDERAKQGPDALAVQYGSVSLTYSQLLEQSNSLSAQLQQAGVSAQSRVALCVTPSVEMVVAMLGIIKAGATYVPLDPAYPAQRLAFILNDIDASLVISDGSSENLTLALEDQQRPVLGVDASQPAPVNSAVSNHGSSIAYVIYTSGSTGNPKGVCVTHKAIAGLVRETDYVDLQPGDAVAQVANVSFDAATFEIWGALLNGACIKGIDRTTSLSPEKLNRIIRQESITTMFLTTALFNQLVREMPSVFENLTTLMFGGEMVDPDAVNRALAAGQPERLLHVYGPTECTTFSSWHPVKEVSNGSVPIGGPVGNTSLYVVDADFRLVPTGTAGQLLVGGPRLAQGYLNQPAMTAEKFVPDPFCGSDRGGDRLYCTGDRVRQNADGTIEFLGRFDSQVKIRGFRIELEEVENVLRQLPEVKDCVAAEHAGALIAYFTTVEDQFTDVDNLADRLKKALSSRLPRYMVPDVLICIDEFELGTTGKINRKALPPPDFSARSEQVPPATETEKVISQIFSEVLGVESIGALDDFFDLGGHSLLAIRIISRLRSAFSLDLGVENLFEHTTPRSLASFVEGEAGSGKLSESVTIPKRADEATVPASFAQQRLWFLAQWESSADAYNMPGATRVRGPLDLQALEKALNTLVDRHEVLRTNFIEENGLPLQKIHAERRLALRITDISNRVDPEALIHKRISDEAEAGFDLRHDPLVRMSILKLGRDDHVLMVTLHHIIADGWSLHHFNEELLYFYDAFSKGQNPNLEPLAIQYADYSVWLSQQMTAGRFDAQRSYWHENLEGADQLLDLPFDRPRPSEQTFKGKTLHFSLDSQRSIALRRISRNHQATDFMVLLAPFAVLLSRYAGKHDFLLGTPVANRPYEELEPLIGFLVNTLLLRLKVLPGITFSSLLEQIRETTLGAFNNQEYPFERIVEELNPERNLQHSPLFQVMFIVQNAPSSLPVIEGCELEEMNADVGVAKFDLTVSLTPTSETAGDGYQGEWEYNTDLFDESTAHQMLNHYLALLDCFIHDEQQPVDRAPMLSEAELGMVVGRSGINDRELLPVHLMFEEQAAKYPSARAVTVIDDADSALCYDELNRQANRLANYLIEQRYEPDSVVGVCAGRRTLFPVACLATLKAGLAFMPIDVTTPPSRLEELCEEAGVSLVITEGSISDDLGKQPIPRLVLRDINKDLQGYSDDNPNLTIHLEQLAYTICTSGSSGRPKAVCVTHRSLSNLIAFHLKRQGKFLTTLQFTSHSFDVIMQELFSTFCAGGELVIPDADTRVDPAKLLSVIREQHIERLFLPFVALDTLSQSYKDDPRSFAEKALPIRTITTAGEQLRMTEALRELLAAHPDCRLINDYGPTETHLTTSYPLPDDRDAWENLPPIGTAIDGHQAYVVDRDLQPTPIGVPGELLVGGRGLARGYRGRPGITASSFLPDPFSAIPGARLYRTGDLVRLKRTGHGDELVIHYLGRMDRQVKVRGFRVEPGEVEIAIRRLPGINNAAVWYDKERNRLVALITSANTALNMPAVREQLLEMLPEYMVPSIFQMTSSLPVLTSGKIDYMALPALLREESKSDQDSIGNGFDPVLDVLGSTWRQLLDVPQVQMTDSFFELGGHSLLATQLLARIERLLGVTLSVKQVFENPTFERQLQLIKVAITHDRPQRDSQTITPVKDPHQLSLSQKRLWLLAQLDPSSNDYNLPVALSIRGPLDVVRLEQAINTIACRHDVLRSEFRQASGVPILHISDHKPIGLIEEEVNAEAAELILNAEANRIFDLEKAPLWSLRLLKISTEERRLLITFHHAISDAWSIKVFLDELALAYEDPARLQPLSVQFADYAHWQQSNDGKFEDSLEFWREHMRDAPAELSLPLDFPRSRQAAKDGALLSFEMAADEQQALQQLALSNNVSLYMVLLSAFSVLMARYSGERSVPVGTVVANRPLIELEPLIGFFSNTLVINTVIGEGQPFADLLSQTRETLLEIFAHQDMPFEKLVEALQPERSLSHSPLFQVAFTYQNEDLRPPEMEGLEIAFENVASSAAKFDLTLSVSSSAKGLSCAFEYNTGLFREATINNLIVSYQALLAGALANPESAWDRLPIIAPVEAQRSCRQISGDQGEYSSESGIHKLLEGFARSQPDAIALESSTRRLTYRELNLAANELAVRLLALGLQPEQRVGVYAGHRIETVIGFIAIAKVGGCYVPLDPGYPSARLQYMVNDASPVVLMTEDGKCQLDLPAGCQVVTMKAPVIDPSHEDPGLNLSSDLAAYMIYTSGTTGQPKGAVLAHRGLNNLARWQQQTLEVSGNSKILQFASLSFDASIWEICMALSNGATLYLASEDERLPGKPLARTLQDADITHVTLPPSVISSLVDNASQFDSLRYLVSAGEPCPPELPGLFPALNFINAYGPTEDTVCTTAMRQDGAGDITIGQGILNRRIYVLDESMQMVPDGVVGELYIAGPGLARGYHEQPGLTAGVFVPNPFGAAGERLYRTGDWVRVNHEGMLTYVGRRDQQVKVRGFRIELGEVMAAISAHPNVAAEWVMTDPLGMQRLLAFYNVRNTGVSPEELRRFVASRLADYMVPSVFLAVDEFPRTPNGKIDESALHQFMLAQQRAEPSGALQRELTPTETALIPIWQEVLALDNISHESHFFELGGHSLLATQLASQINERLPAGVDLRSVFEYPVLSDLAFFIDQSIPVKQHGSPITRSTYGDVAPVSFGQERLWFLEKLTPGAAYNMPLVIRFRPSAADFDPAIFDVALAQLIDRHGVLQFCYPANNGFPEQKVAPRVARQFTEIAGFENLHTESAAVQRWLEQEVSQPFDLETGPVFRVHRIRLADNEHLLVWVFHHIAADGRSIEILLRDFCAFCDDTPLPDLPVTYADYAVWQRENDDQWQEALDYWTEQLATAPRALDLPTDKRRPAVWSNRGATCGFSFSKELSLALTELANRAGVSLYMLMLTVFALLLNNHSGQNDIVIGSPASGRGQRTLDDLFGFFVNTIAVRIRLGHDPRVNDLLATVRETTLEALDYQHLPFEKLVDALHPRRTLSHSPVFQVMFSLQEQRAEDTALRIIGGSLSPIEVHTNSAKFDITLAMAATDREISGSFEYNPDLFDLATIERLAEHLEALSWGMVAGREKRISEIDLRDANELKQGGARQIGSLMPAHRQFEQQARLLPARLALVEGNTAGSENDWTYEMLNNAANRMSRVLSDVGAGPEKLIGLLMPRSADAIIGLLAVMKSGSAFVPLDPNAPDARNAVIAEDLDLIIVAPQCEGKSFLAEVPVVHSGSWKDTPAADDPALSIEMDALAYVLYTSGSTGKPKACQMTHANLASYLKWAISFYSDIASSRFGWFTTLGFDFTLTGIFSPLLTGERLTIHPERESVLDSLKLELTGDAGAIKLTPSHVSLISQLPIETTDINLAILGGEDLHTDHVKHLLALNPGMTIVNEYGPTEATVGCIVKTIASDETRITIGKPIHGVSAYVLDGHDRLAAVGIRGELCLAGPGLSRGYKGQPALTASRFRPNPFSDIPGDRLYRTGDLARVLPDGELELLGRIDHQIKFHGYRIELDEVRECLLTHEAIADAAVLVTENASGDDILVAYIVSEEDDQQIDQRILRQHLSNHLPTYMVPQHFSPIPSIPLNNNGKLDRAALPGVSEGLTSRKITAPETDLQQSLVEIWQKILGIDVISIHDDFFDLGGHSIKSLGLIATIEKELGLTLSLSDFFAAPTVMGIEQALTSNRLPNDGALVQMNSRCGGIPLVALPGANGDVLYFTELARAMNETRMLYGLQLPGTSAESDTVTDLGELASRLVEDLSGVLPGNSFALAGHSFGGKVIFEMARQLEAVGSPPNVLVMMDPALPIDLTAAALYQKTTAEWYLEYARLMQALNDTAETVDAQAFLSGTKAEQLDVIARLMSQAGWRNANAVMVERLIRVYINNHKMVYVPKAPINTRIVVIRSMEENASVWSERGLPALDSIRENENLGWDRFSTQPVETHWTPGDHLSMFKSPHVEQLAHRLESLINSGDTDD